MTAATIADLRIQLDDVEPAVMRRIEVPLAIRLDRLNLVLEDVGARSLKYLYDFGDGWEHTVRIERVTEAVPGLVYPRLIAATGRCPPEDVGGPWGYREFLEAIADPDHEEHAERLEWIGGAFEPTDVGLDGLTEALDRLARKWAPRRTTRKRTT